MSDATLGEDRVDRSITQFPPMADSIVNELVNASGDPRNLMYPRDGRPGNPGVHPCVDAGCARSTQPAYGDRPQGQAQMTLVDKSSARFRPREDIPEP